MAKTANDYYNELINNKLRERDKNPLGYNNKDDKKTSKNSLKNDILNHINTYVDNIIKFNEESNNQNK